MKTFSPGKFRQDLKLVPWSVCDIFDDVDDLYYVWNSLFTDVNDHAPLKTRRCKKREVPWMNAEIRELMRLRDQTHCIAIKSKDVSYIQLYKCMRNRITIEVLSPSFV